MSDSDKVDAYIKKKTKFKDQLAAIRAILSSVDLVETVKWGSPSYTHR